MPTVPRSPAPSQFIRLLSESSLLGELRFSLTLRVVPTDLRVILDYLFLRFFDPEI